MVKRNFLSNALSEENMHYTCIACITIVSVMKIGKKKKNYQQVYLEECKYRVKKIQMSRFISTELDLLRIQIQSQIQKQRQNLTLN